LDIRKKSLERIKEALSDLLHAGVIHHSKHEKKEENALTDKMADSINEIFIDIDGFQAAREIKRSLLLRTDNLCLKSKTGETKSVKFYNNLLKDLHLECLYLKNISENIDLSHLRFLKILQLDGVVSTLAFLDKTKHLIPKNIGIVLIEIYKYKKSKNFILPSEDWEKAQVLAADSFSDAFSLDHGLLEGDTLATFFLLLSSLKKTIDEKHFQGYIKKSAI
jgi:hypothetical protein